jgi:hypothetical protein
MVLIVYPFGPRGGAATRWRGADDVLNNLGNSLGYDWALDLTPHRPLRHPLQCRTALHLRADWPRRLRHRHRRLGFQFKVQSDGRTAAHRRR